MNTMTDECLSCSYLLSSRGRRDAPASAAAVGSVRVWKVWVEQCLCLGGGEPKKTYATIRAGDSKDRVDDKNYLIGVRSSWKALPAELEEGSWLVEGMLGWPDCWLGSSREPWETIASTDASAEGLKMNMG